MTESDSGPPKEWLRHLYQANQWERLENAAADCLAADPDDREAHFWRAWALLNLSRAPEMQPHIEFLLAEDAENVEHLRLAALWHLNQGRHAKASDCLVSAIRADPEEASLWHLAAVVETKWGRFGIARQAIHRARELDPDDADIAHLHITLHSMEQRGTKAAWEKVREYEKALQLDPENDTLIASLGDVFLEELEAPARAEELYRQALTINPRHRLHRKRLCQAMQNRHLLFRTLRLPFSAFDWGWNFLRGSSDSPFALVFLVKLGVLGLIWWVFAAAIFAPPALMVEWMVMADIDRASRTADKVGRWWLRFHHLPFSVRLMTSLALTAVFWWGLFVVFDYAPSEGFVFVGSFFACHLLFMSICVLWGKLDAWWAARKARLRGNTAQAGDQPASLSLRADP